MSSSRGTHRTDWATGRKGSRISRRTSSSRPLTGRYVGPLVTDSHSPILSCELVRNSKCAEVIPLPLLAYLDVLNILVAIAYSVVLPFTETLEQEGCSSIQACLYQGR